MPNVAHLDRNECASCEYHQQLSPALLQINADTFGKENCRVKQRQKTCRAQRAACQHRLEFVEQEMDGFAVLQKEFVSGPVRNPSGAQQSRPFRSEEHTSELQ